MSQLLTLLRHIWSSYWFEFGSREFEFNNRGIRFFHESRNFRMWCQVWMWELQTWQLFFQKSLRLIVNLRFLQSSLNVSSILGSLGVKYTKNLHILEFWTWIILLMMNKTIRYFIIIIPFACNLKLVFSLSEATSVFLI